MIFGVYDIVERIDFDTCLGGDCVHPIIHFKEGRPIPFWQVACRLVDYLLCADNFVFQFGIGQIFWMAMQIGVADDFVSACDDGFCRALEFMHI